MGVIEWVFAAWYLGFPAALITGMLCIVKFGRKHLPEVTANSSGTFNKAIEIRNKSLLRLSKYETDNFFAAHFPEMNSLENPLTRDYIHALRRVTKAEEAYNQEPTESSAERFLELSRTFRSTVINAELPLINNALETGDLLESQKLELQEHLQEVNNDKLQEKDDFRDSFEDDELNWTDFWDDEEAPKKPLEQSAEYRDEEFRYLDGKSKYELETSLKYKLLDEEKYEVIYEANLALKNKNKSLTDLEVYDRDGNKKNPELESKVSIICYCKDCVRSVIPYDDFKKNPELHKLDSNSRDYIYVERMMALELRRADSDRELELEKASVSTKKHELEKLRKEDDLREASIRREMNIWGGEPLVTKRDRDAVVFDLRSRKIQTQIENDEDLDLFGDNYLDDLDF